MFCFYFELRRSFRLSVDASLTTEKKKNGGSEIFPNLRQRNLFAGGRGWFACATASSAVSDLRFNICQ
jgi:hypothetical protein